MEKVHGIFETYCSTILSRWYFNLWQNYVTTAYRMAMIELNNDHDNDNTIWIDNRKYFFAIAMNYEFGYVDECDSIFIGDTKGAMFHDYLQSNND